MAEFLLIAPDLAAIARAAPITRCPDCGYAREGLAAEQPCPECGWKPEADVVVLYVEGRAWPTSRDWRWWAGCLVIPAMIVLMEGLSKLFNRQTGRLLLMGVWVAISIGTIWWVRLLRRETGATLQVRLAPHGYAIRYGFGPATWKRWRRSWRVRVKSTWWAGRRRMLIGPTAGWKYFFVLTPLDIILPPNFVAEPELRRQIRDWLGAAGA